MPPDRARQCQGHRADGRDSRDAHPQRRRLLASWSFGTVGHYNPDGSPHGEHTKHDDGVHHAGDLPQLVVDDALDGALNATTAHFTLAAGAERSLFDTDGSSIMIHANVDTFTAQPSGNAGPRVACGVIVQD